MKRFVALVVALCVGAAVTVWLVTRSDGPRKYDTPEAAVRAECHAVNAKAQELLPPDQAGQQGLAYSVWVTNHRLVDWTAPGSPLVWIATTQHPNTGKYWLTTGKKWVNNCKYAHYGRSYSELHP